MNKKEAKEKIKILMEKYIKLGV